MSRTYSYSTVKREIKKDSIFQNQIVSKFVNCLMYDGKKALAEKILMDVFYVLQNESKGNPLSIFNEAINRCRPLVQLKLIRIGGVTYKVPVELNPDRQINTAIKWIIKFSRERPEKGIVKQLSSEILDIVKKQGITLKKREEIHKIAEANRSFSHFRW